MTARPLPLNDFLVIDLTAHRAGPTAVRQLPDELRPTPGQGEHTDTVLRELGYDAAAITGLRERGAV